jgi:DNA mismatch endonuclease (patch repair protein)
MSRVRSRNTAPELIVRRTAHAIGLRFRLYRNDLPGTPDLVFPRWKAAIFVHGCFWHRHEGCRKATIPKSRLEYWQSKFERNVERDRRILSELRARGWRTLIIWQCQTEDSDNLTRRLSQFFGLPGN